MVDGGEVVCARAISGGRWHGGKRETRMVVGWRDDDGAVVPPSPVGSCRCCSCQKRPVPGATLCWSAYHRTKLPMFRDTTTCARPGDPSLLHCYRSEEALAWRAVHARDQGKAPAPHNLQIGISGGAGRIWPGGGGRRLRVAQSGMGTTPLDGRSIADGLGRRIRSGGMIGSIGGAPAGARSFASDRGRRRLDWKRMGGHMRGRMTRACGKADERTIDESIDGGGTLSRETVAMNFYQQRTPDSSGGIKSSIDRSPNQCDFRLGGILSSGKARIGINGVAGSGGTAGTPNFKSMLRPFAAASVLPQAWCTARAYLALGRMGW